MRQTLLEEISGPRRAHLHWRIGEALAASGNAPHGAIAHHLCEGVLAGDPRIAAEAAVVAAEEAAAIGALDAADDYAHRALALIDDSALDAPELRCHAILVIGDCRSWNQVGDPAAVRALVREAGRLAVEHGWPDIAARAALPTHSTPTSPTPPRRSSCGPRSTWAPTTNGGQRWSRSLPGWSSRTATGPTTSAAIAEVEAAVAEVDRCDPLGRMLVADNRWWLHFPEADVDDRRLARDIRVAADAVGGTSMLQAFKVALIASLRHGDRDDFDALFAEFAAFAARTGLGQADVSMMETAVALLDGRLADAERLAFDGLSKLHADSANAASTAAQISMAWSWTWPR